MKFLKKIGGLFYWDHFNKIIVFSLLPIYTANFDPASYGDNDLSMTTVTMLASLLFMEVWTPLLRFSYDEHTLEGKQKDIYQCRFFIGRLFSSLYRRLCADCFLAGASKSQGG